MAEFQNTDLTENLNLDESFLDKSAFQEQDLSQEQTPNFATTSQGTIKPQAKLGLDNPFLSNQKSSLSNSKSVDEFFQKSDQIARGTDRFYGTGATQTPINKTSQIKKYEDQDYGYIFGIDNDDFYGQREGVFLTLGKAIPRFVGLTIAKVGEGIGFTAGLLTNLDAIGSNEGIVSKAADNALYEAMSKFEDNIKTDWLPTFQEAADREKGFWSRAFTDLDFWTDDVVDGAAFMASAFVPGMALSKIGLGTRLMRGLGGLTRFGASGLGATVEGAEAIGNFFSKAQTIGKGIDKFNTWALATAGEAMFEAKEVRDNIRESLTYDEYGNRVINPKTGQPYTQEEIDRIAGGGAQNTFLMNAALLGATNVFQLRTMNKLFGMGEKSLAKSSDVITGGFGSKALANSMLNPRSKMLKEFALSVGREGFVEENLQLAIQRYNQDYGLMGEVAKLSRTGTYLGLLGQYTNQTLKALTGKDTETATNIGLGAILGGGSAVIASDAKKQKKTAEALAAQYNVAQDNWLKFGNIYKTEDVETKDAAGNPIKTKKVVFDQSGAPVIDESLLNSVVTGFTVNADLLSESEKNRNRGLQKAFKMEAFSNFVVAHINASAEDGLMRKLDDILNMSPGEMAKLGFTADANLSKEVNKYKSIAQSIIKQNEILNSSILFDGSKIDQSRKNFLTQLGAKQVVYKNLAGELSDEINSLKSELIPKDATSLSDGLVDQLNDLQIRINLQQQVLDHLNKTESKDSMYVESAKNTLNGLKNEYKLLIANNETSLKTLKKREDGFYNYEKAERNDPLIQIQLLALNRDKLSFLNEVKSIGNQWALIADNASGKDYFIKNKDQQQEKAKKVVEAEKKKAESLYEVKQNEDGTYSVIDSKGVIVKDKIQTEEEANKIKEDKVKEAKPEEPIKKTEIVEEEEGAVKAQPVAEEDKINVNDELVGKVFSSPSTGLTYTITGVDLKKDKITWTANNGSEGFWTKARFDRYIDDNELFSGEFEFEMVGEQPEGDEDVPSLELYLYELYNDILENNPEMPDYEVWRNSAAVNTGIIKYNKQYNKSEPLFKDVKQEEKKTDEIDNLVVKEVKSGIPGFDKFVGNIVKLYKKVKNDVALRDKLINKLGEIEDEATRDFILKSLQEPEVKSTYVPIFDLIDNAVQINFEVGYDKTKMNTGEFQSGFVLRFVDKAKKAFSYSPTTTTGEINNQVKVVASIKRQKDQTNVLKELKKTNPDLQNRTIVTHENNAQIDQLKRGIPVLTTGSNTTGIDINISNRNDNKNTMYVVGIQNYAIVYPDNTTEKVTFSEEQRNFVKQNLLIDGNKITDEQYDRLKSMYAAYEQFEKEALSYFEDTTDDTADVTELFNKYFSLSAGGFKAKTGEPLVNVIERNKNKLFSVTIEDKAGNIIEKELPLIATRLKVNEPWVFDFPLEEGESVVVVNKKTGEVDYVTDFTEYLKDVHQISPTIPKNIGAVKAWVSKDETAERGYKPYALDKKISTEPVDDFKAFAKDFKELKETLENPENIAAQKWMYKGKLYTNVNSLMLAFNISNFGFYKLGGNKFVANFSYNPNSTLSTKFLIEIRPLDRSISLTSEQKRKLNAYFSEDSITTVTDSSSNADVERKYREFYNEVMRALNQQQSALLEKDVDNVYVDPLLQKFAVQLNGYRDLYMYRENERGEKQYFLKLHNKQQGRTDLKSLIYNAREAKGEGVKLALRDVPVKPAVTPTSVALTAPVSTDIKPAEQTGNRGTEIIDVEDDDAYMLNESEEALESYTAESFNEELQFLNRVLKETGISFKDLSSIISKVGLKKQVLGYYKDRVIYANQNMSARGAIYHEAFHALYRDLFTATEREFYLTKAKAKLGKISQERINEFRNDRKYFNKTDAEIVDLIAEEYLADGFRNYKLNNVEPKESWFKKFVNKLKKIFDFFFKNQDDIDALYKDFDQGKYSNRYANPINISNEGVYSIVTGRPKLAESFKPDGTRVFSKSKGGPVNASIQNELINKISYYVANDSSDRTFNEKFQTAVSKVRDQYDIEKLINSVDLSKEDADTQFQTKQSIRNKYQELFHDASYILGVSVPFSLDESLANDEEAQALNIPVQSVNENLDIIKSEVEGKIKTLGLQKGLSVDNLELPEDDEDKAEKEKGGEFDTIHMNPLEGLTREFRSLFGLIPYTVKDSLGVETMKMADGNMLFNAMMKISSDKPLDQILPTLGKSILSMKEDKDVYAAPLEAFGNFIAEQFGVGSGKAEDLADPTNQPTRNFHLYKQFIDTFFVTELPSNVVVLKQGEFFFNANVYDASINQDIEQKKQRIARDYDSNYRRLKKSPEALKGFYDRFEKLKTFIKQDLDRFLKSNDINKRAVLNKNVDKLKNLFDGVGITLPKSLIRQSLLGIYNIELNKDFDARSKQNINDIETDMRLMKEGSYLQNDFFQSVAKLEEKDYEMLFQGFEEAKKEKDPSAQFNVILKKAIKYAIKYDVNSAVSVHQNAENKNVYRYTRYTPPLLLAQIIREEGVDKLTSIYPVLKDFFNDNPLFDSSNNEHMLFLSNFFISAFGGFRMEDEKNPGQPGATFGSIDSKSLAISNLINFMNREKITSFVKDSKGKKQPVGIVTFKRSRTQEEATTTNFLVTGLYEKFTAKDSTRPNDKFLKVVVSIMKQEYNRISREWNLRKDLGVVRYNGYNNNIHPETKLPIEGDSFTLANGKKVKLRAYQFKMFEHFFDEQATTEENSEVREILRDRLRDLAMSGVSFEEAIKDSYVEENLLDQYSIYMEETFKNYSDFLLKNGIFDEININGDSQNKNITSNYIPNAIKVVGEKAQSIEDSGYDDFLDLARDHHYNVWANKLMVNQIFDGDIAIGIKNAVEYYKRNKSGVISGNSLKTGIFRTAIVENIQSLINEDDLTEYAEDFDAVTKEITNKSAVDIADGQAYHTINHRIRMYDSWGRVDASVRKILNASKYRKLTFQEVKTLQNKKVVLNTVKTATGGILEYYKLSEHLINRQDVSYLSVPQEFQGLELDAIYEILDDIYSEIELKEDKIVNNSDLEDVEKLQSEIEELYKDVHQFWSPKRGKEELHYLLNSMELDGIDMVMDPNASKKSTIVPSGLNRYGRSNLKTSKSSTQNLFKFLQVETSGVKNIITMPSQARQLVNTYLNLIKSDSAYKNKSIKELAVEYSKTLGDITTSSMNMLNKSFIDENGEVVLTDLFDTMHRGLRAQGADSNTLKFFEVRDGKPVHNVNEPVIKQIFTYYYFALFNDSVFKQTVSGRSDILVSSFGYKVVYDTQDNNRIITQIEQDQNREKYNDNARYKTRNLGVSVEQVNGKKVYTVEVIIPEPLSKNPKEKELLLNQLTKFFSTRIPTEDKRSMIVAKVVDYMDGSYLNSIVVPQLVHVLAGSDLDVDKLYSHTFDYYIDINNQPHVYGDYSNYATKSQGQFVEYIYYMLNNPAIKDLVDSEYEKMTNNFVLTKDFLKLKDDLGISEEIENKEELEQNIKELKESLPILKLAKQELEDEQKIRFKQWLSAKKTAKNRENWLSKRAAYLEARDNYYRSIEELDAYEDQLETLQRTQRIAALVNVLNNKKLPVTMAGFTNYKKQNPNPVVPVLHNESLDQKIAILSNEEVFKNWYIKEKSSTDRFKAVANSIGATVEDVVKANSIYSIMGDIVANELNSSNKDGIGISASFNKFIAFAQKSGLKLDFDLFSTYNGNKEVEGINLSEIISYNDFQNTDAIRRIGESLGMFADAAKDPIPSVLNLNPTTAGVSNLLVSMSGDLQLALLINKIPFIEKIVKEYNESRSIADNSLFKPGLRSLLKSEMKNMLLNLEGREPEIYEFDDRGNPIAYKKFIIKTTKPNKNFVKKDSKDVTIKDLGFELYYENGQAVLPDVANVLLANLYINSLIISSDVLKLGSVLNLIKQQDADFAKVDEIVGNYYYLIGGDSVFGDSIKNILLKSEEYQPLIKSLLELDKYASKLLIERSPLFLSMRNATTSGFNNTSNFKNASRDLNDQFTKYIVINKYKGILNKEIESLKSKTDSKSVARYELFNESLKYFTSDFWLRNNSFENDLDYLLETNSGNPFVDFLVVRERKSRDSEKNIKYLEASSRMKLLKDETEDIIKGFEALYKSKDMKAKRLASEMFFYLLAKDGLGYGSFSFVKYLSPDMSHFKELSDSLYNFQNLLLEQQSYLLKKQKDIQAISNSDLSPSEKAVKTNKVVKDILKKYNDLFDNFFDNTENKGKVDWVGSTINKIFAYSGNLKYVKEAYSIRLADDSKVSTLNYLIKNGVFSNIEKDTTVSLNNIFDYYGINSESFTVDFTDIADKPSEVSFDTVNTLFKNHYFVVDPITANLSRVVFPFLIKKENTLYKLTEINDRSVSEAIVLKSLNLLSSSSNPNAGLKAKYVQIKPEGTNNLLNFGFTTKDGSEIYDWITSKPLGAEAEYFPEEYQPNEIDNEYYGSDDIREGVYEVDSSEIIGFDSSDTISEGPQESSFANPEEFTGVYEIDEANFIDDIGVSGMAMPLQQTPTVDNSITGTGLAEVKVVNKPWEDQKKGLGVSVIRGAYKNYGNVFTHLESEQTKFNLIKKGSVKEATDSYREWLLGTYVPSNEEERKILEENEERRKYILKQINSGALNGKFLLYWTTGSYNHATVLRDLVNSKMKVETVKEKSQPLPISPLAETSEKTDLQKLGDFYNSLSREDQSLLPSLSNLEDQYLEIPLDGTVNIFIEGLREQIKCKKG
jgi:hypothetical protein